MQLLGSARHRLGLAVGKETPKRWSASSENINYFKEKCFKRGLEILGYSAELTSGGRVFADLDYGQARFFHSGEALLKVLWHFNNWFSNL